MASQHNPPLEDLATAMTGSLPVNGSAPMVAGLPMGGFQVNNMADGVLPTDGATVGQSSTAAAIAITTAPLKATPVDADTIPLVDSVAGNVMKRLTWANLKSLFQPVNAVLTALGGIGTAVAGDIIYSSAAGVWARKAKGADGQVLTLASGLPAWATNAPDFGAGNAALAAGGVGTYGLFLTVPAVSLGFGSTVAGSTLRPSHAGGFAGSPTPSGTWRCLGVTSNFGGASAVSLFQRIA